MWRMERTYAAHDESCLHFAGVMHQKPVFKNIDSDVGKHFGNIVQHIPPIGYRVGATFIRINADGDDEFVKHRLRLPYHP